MHLRLVLLLSVLLVAPGPASAGFLGRSAEHTTNTPSLLEPSIPSPPPQGLASLAGRANARAAIHILGFTPEPFDPDPPGGGEAEIETPNSTVPEPSPGLLTALGLVTLALRRRRAA